MGQDPGRRSSQGFRRAAATRLPLLVITGVSLYILWPSMVKVFAAWPDLVRLDHGWLLAMAVAEVASFACLWGLQGLLLHTRRWFLVATAQVTGNAFGRIVPGGAAAAGAMQYRMLTRGGLDPTAVASGLTASQLVSSATLALLPLIAVPTILGSTPVADGLKQAAIFGIVAFVLFLVVGVVLLWSDRALGALGRATEWALAHLPGHLSRRPGLPQRLISARNRIRTTLQSRWWVALLAAGGNWGLDYLALLAAVAAVGSRPNPSVLLLAYATSALLGILPFTPGGLGFVEAGLTATLALAGVSAADAVVATLAYRLASYWLPLLAGPVARTLYSRRYGRLARGMVT